ncbi:MAG: IclR family transcriptional regulator [Microbacterium sp.]|jgi:IclR family acetate operon transcriptional repressor|uniref:IclR family transcriptional regulator n=1 Tax=Microbacterium sp. TaxID=51671 RepID=UPI0028337D04|nr:IclR family transcriptional regulator [Microbacterium sp.]MDR2323594.1 IclR family transcriptional regulator [Microbacterium sp.]
MELNSTSYHSQGLTRGLAALRVLGAEPQPMSLAALSRALDLPKPTVVRLLAVMEREGFVTRVGQPPMFTLGPSLYALTESLGPADLSQLTAPTMKALADELGFTTNLGVLQGRAVLHLAVEEPARALRIAAGGFLDHTYCTGLGKMLLSALDPEDVDEHVPLSEPYERFTDATITDRTSLDRELVRIRERGTAIDDQERNRGVRCMAILVPTADELAISLSVSGPAGELGAGDEARVLHVLNEAAAAIAELPRLSGALQTVRDRLALA